MKSDMELSEQFVQSLYFFRSFSCLFFSETARLSLIKPFSLNQTEESNFEFIYIILESKTKLTRAIGHSGYHVRASTILWYK